MLRLSVTGVPDAWVNGGRSEFLLMSLSSIQCRFAGVASALACSLLAAAPNASGTNVSITTRLSRLTEWLGASILWFSHPSLAQVSSARERRAWDPAERSCLDWQT